MLILQICLDVALSYTTILGHLLKCYTFRSDSINKIYFLKIVQDLRKSEPIGHTLPVFSRAEVTNQTVLHIFPKTITRSRGEKDLQTVLGSLGKLGEMEESFGKF